MTFLKGHAFDDALGSAVIQELDNLVPPCLLRVKEDLLAEVLQRDHPVSPHGTEWVLNEGHWNEWLFRSHETAGDVWHPVPYAKRIEFVIVDVLPHTRWKRNGSVDWKKSLKRIARAPAYHISDAAAKKVWDKETLMWQLDLMILFLKLLYNAVEN